MRFRQRLPQMQAAMRKRWAKRRTGEGVAYRAAQECFLREFDELCLRYSLNLGIKYRMIQQFRKRMESRDEQRIRQWQQGQRPLL
jgi:hypothetical protein